MNAEQIILAAIPEAGESIIEHILWGRTPFPCGAITAKSLYKAAHQYKRASDNDIRLCDQCSNKAELDSWTCGTCKRMLNEISDEKETI